MTGRSWIYTHRVRRSPDLFPRHSVVNQWDLLAPLGIDDCTPERDPVEMAEDAASVERVARRLESAGIGGGRSTRGRARERGQRVSPLAGRVVLLDDCRPGRGRSAPPHHRRVRAVGCRGGPAGDRRGPCAALDSGRAAAAPRVGPGRASGPHRPRGGVHWGRQRPAAPGVHDPDADRGAARADAARAIPSVAGQAAASRDCGRRPFAVPAVRSASLYTWGFPVPDEDRPGTGALPRWSAY